MSGSAGVRSIDAVEVLARALCAFGEETTAALADAGMEVNRALQWVEHDQREYWSTELRRAQAQAEEARLNLERRRMIHVGDREPPCREEKMALDAAKRRVARAREKIEAVRRWGRILEQEFGEYRGGIAPLVAWLQADMPRALALLRGMDRALEAYVQVPVSPGDGPGSAALHPAQPAAGGHEESAADSSDSERSAGEPPSAPSAAGDS